MTEQQTLSTETCNPQLTIQLATILLAEAKGDLANANHHLVAKVEQELGTEIWSVIQAVLNQEQKK